MPRSISSIVGAIEQREVAQIAPGVPVVDVHEELVELVRRRERRVEPNGPGLTLAKLGARRRRDERRRDGMGVGSECTTNQLDSGGDVSPLIATAHLESNVVASAQLQKVVRL